MSTETAGAVPGEKNYNAALTSGGIPFGKPTEAEKARFDNVMGALYEKRGARSIQWLSERIQEVADGHGGEFITTIPRLSCGELSLVGLPTSLQFGDENSLGDVRLFFVQKNPSECLPISKVRLSERLCVDLHKNILRFWHAPQVSLEVNFANINLQKIDNCNNASTLDHCRSKIVEAGCTPEGYMSFLACMFFVDRWPVFWKKVFRYGEGGKDLNRIVFLGTRIEFGGNSPCYYPGFMLRKKILADGSFGSNYVAPTLFNAGTDMGPGCREDYFFAFKRGVSI